MIPPIYQTTNWRASQNEVARNYTEAIQANNVKHVVNLSSIGAHLGNGTGPVDALYDFEQMLNSLTNLHVKHLRPSFFYYNFMAQIPLAKQASILGGNYGEPDGEKLLLVHTEDIAAAALEELTQLSFTGSSVRYIYSDERSAQEIAQVLGNAIDKPLNWVVFTDEQQKQGLLQAGLGETHAQGYADLGQSLRSGRMQADAKLHKPTPGNIKLEQFAKEFAGAFAAS